MKSWLCESDIEEIIQNLGKDAEIFSGKTVLLTGGFGFLGQYFIDVFVSMNRRLRKPLKLIVLDNLIVSGKKSAGFNKGDYTFINHDVVRPFRFSKPVHFIIQAAGIASPFYYQKYPLETLETATMGTKNMLLLAHEKKAKLLFFSSSEIYGNPDPRFVPTSESYRGYVSCLGPRACYDESKRLGESLCYIFHTQFKTHSTIVRPFNVYGPGMKEKDHRVMPSFASSILTGRPVRLFGHGKNTRTFCYASDAIAGFLKVLIRGRAAEPYNIGNSSPEVSMEDLLHSIERILGRKVKRLKMHYPKGYPSDEPRRRCPDLHKAKTELGYEPRVSLEEGLKRFFDWAQKMYQER